MDRVSAEVEAERPAWNSGGPLVAETLQKLGARGLDPEVASEIITSVSRIVASELDSARGSAGVIEVMRAVVGLAGQVVRGVREDAQRRKLPIAKTACDSGCAHCCRLHVSISPPEAIVLAAFLRDTRKDVDQILARLDTRPDCPLLVREQCIAYPVRPLACAAANSLDAEACARGGEIPIEGHQLGAIRATQIGLSLASMARGLDFDRYELRGALRVALTTPDAAERWLRGERLFTQAAGDPVIDKTIEAFLARDPALT
jgi:uncharacterized protein